MLPDLPIPTASNDLLLLALYIGAAIAIPLYLYQTFVAPKLREAAKPDYEMRTQDLMERYRADELKRGPDYLLPGEMKHLEDEAHAPHQDSAD
ncbi:MAG: hypothetical protein AAFP18_04085 [Bacteroidota bacterium]